jgi:hypothetical protein
MKRIACLTAAAAAMAGGILYMASALGQTDVASRGNLRELV